MGDHEPEYGERLDLALTDVIRMSRHARIAEIMSDDVDAAVDRRLLVLLGLIADRGPIRASDLVDLMAVDQSTVSRQLAALVASGLVSRAVDPTDRRAALVEVTPAGREAITVARGKWRRTLADLTAGWSPDQRESLLETLEQLATGLHCLIDRPPRRAPRVTPASTSADAWAEGSMLTDR